MRIGGKTSEEWERIFEAKVKSVAEVDARLRGGHDPAHDHAHFCRVVAQAKRLAATEGARLEIVIPAAWLHDLVNVPKNDPRRSQASRLSAEAAKEFFAQIEYPREHWDEIAHAIEAHSFSAKIEPRTIEAAVVQDADRLDGLGAIGIARVFSVGGLLRRAIYSPEDPFGKKDRALDDLVFTLDHFFVKLFRVVETLRTEAGKAEGQARARFMHDYLKQLAHEIGVVYP